jgi:hypothetical protein
MEEGVRIHFEGFEILLENWNHGQEFNWDDWRSNFDMSEDRWFDNYDWSVIFPHQYEENGIHYSCDDMNTCWTFYEETQESCNYEGMCFTVEGALEHYFEGNMGEHLYEEIENTMIWTMQSEMLSQGMDVYDEEDFMYMFYPVFEQKWYELVDESQT